MTHFAGFAGQNPAVRTLLIEKAGADARCSAVTGVTVVTVGTGGEPVTVAACPGTPEVTVRRGDPRTGSCSVTFTEGGERCPRVDQDAFGQHRVFTARAGDGTTCFASDPRLLTSLTGFASGIDADALKGYVCFSHAPQPLTLWSGITSVPPPPSPWRSADNTDTPTDAATIQSLLHQAVERRLTSGDVGVYLSGGLDSSLIAALLCEAGVRPRLFTLDFGPPFDAELPVARAVADHLGLTLTVVPARPRHILRAVNATARALPQPFGDSVTVPLWLLGEAAAREVAEVWNGEGGDQLFGGWANKPMIAALAHGDDTSPQTEQREYAETYHRFGGITDRLLTPALRDAARAFDGEEWLRPALDRDAHPALLHRLRAANLCLKGAQNIAPRMVALAECHGLRVRAPFFDDVLTHATFALSPAQLLSGACEKYLLKQIAEKYLPPEIVWATKRGMGVPSTEWCLRHGPLGWDIRRRLSPRRLRARGWFEPDLVRGLFRGEDPTTEGSFRRRRIGEKLWLLYMLEVWGEG